MEIDTHGGDLRVAELRKHSVSLDQPSPIRLLDDRGPRVFIPQSGLLGHEGTLPKHKSLYTAEASRYELANGQDALAVRLHWSGPEGMRVTKTYTFHRNDYSIDVSNEVTDAGRKPRDVYLYAQFLRSYEEIRPYSSYCREMIVHVDFEAMMRIALEEASLSRQEGNQGYGAVVVLGQRILSRAHDTTVPNAIPACTPK